MRILVTGSRLLTDSDLVARGLTVAVEELIHRLPGDREIIIVHGAARGADSLAGSWVIKAQKYLSSVGYSLRVEEHPADWATHRNAAGPIRNQEMVNLGADICIAFFKTGAENSGTSNCVAAARRAGIDVLEFRQ